MAADEFPNEEAGRASNAFARAVRANQDALGAQLKPGYDFIVCGSGSAGSVVARRLAENPHVSVLLLEAGGDDDRPEVTNPAAWTSNIGSERDWGFRTLPTPHVNGRSIESAMGKVLGGGSSINAMLWAHGHKNDWDYFAAETGDPAWGYEAVLEIYRRIEDWRGAPDAVRRGVGGPVFIQPAPEPNPVAPAMVEAAAAIGIPKFADHNGAMMEGHGGCALTNLCVRDGRRVSIFRSYLYPYLDRPNLTALTGALVTRVVFDGARAAAVDVLTEDGPRRFAAKGEIILSLGAVQTPKVLMQSGIGDRGELGRFGIEVVQHLPGVGQNFQDHLLVHGCVWEYEKPLPPRNNGAEATFFWKSDPSLDTPDLQACPIEARFLTQEAAGLAPPAECWSMAPALVRPRSRGRLRLTGPGPFDPLDMDSQWLSDPADFEALMACVRICREIGNSAALRPFTKRELVPGALRAAAVEHFVRDAISSFHHQSCSAKMGRDPYSVVDGELKVYGVDGLRVVDASVMPRVTTGNTMGPSVVIGERGGDLVRRTHGV